MRRSLLLLPLLLAPLAARAEAPPSPFCAGLRRLVAAAASGFDYLPANQRLLPGSVEERRGITRTEGGPPRAVFYAVMLQDASRRHPNPVEARFHALAAEITRCLPDATASPAQVREGGAVAGWTTPQALVGLRRDDGQGFASTAEVTLSVASRW